MLCLLRELAQTTTAGLRRGGAATVYEVIEDRDHSGRLTQEVLQMTLRKHLGRIDYLRGPMSLTLTRNKKPVSLGEHRTRLVSCGLAKPVDD
jgi:hypothetical protein